MASAINNNAGRRRLLHVGFMVPLSEVISENETLEHELGQRNLRFNVYSAALFYKDSNQDTLHSWFDQRKRASRTAYLRALYTNNKGDAIVEMDVDGKQFYLIAAANTSKPPNEMKKDISRGLYGERKPFSERIQVPCFPYKYEADAGFIECEAFIHFQKERQQALESAQEEKMVTVQISEDC